MKHRELVDFIIKELEIHGIILHHREDIHKLLLPHEPYSSTYASNWSDWRGDLSKNINKARAKEGIQKTIGFESYIWDADSQTQIQTIRQAVKEFVRPQVTFDLGDLLPQNTPLSNAQTALLIDIRKSTNEQTTKLLASHQRLLDSLPDNQIFLLQLLPLLFEKGMYAMLIEQVFPALLPHNAVHTHVKILKAHTYGSLEKPEYLKAVYLLQTIDPSSHEQVLEVQTGLLSNLRRYTLEKASLTKEELLETLPAFIHHYTYIFENVEPYHYYPATNLAYMLKLSQLISPNEPHIADDDLSRIYTDAKPSILKASHSNSEETRYYATISETELRMLSGRNSNLPSLLTWLDHHQPSSAYVSRSIRMMQFFVQMVERFGEVECDELLHGFGEVMEVLEGYVRHTD